MTTLEEREIKVAGTTGYLEAVNQGRLDPKNPGRPALTLRLCHGNGFWTDYPIRYENGKVAFNNPEWFTKRLREATQKELQRAFLMGTPYSNDHFDFLYQYEVGPLIDKLTGINNRHGRGDVDAVFISSTHPKHDVAEGHRLGVVRIRIPVSHNVYRYEFPEYRVSSGVLHFRGRKVKTAV